MPKANKEVIYGVQVQCHRCGHKWVRTSKSNRPYISCICGTRTKNPAYVNPFIKEIHLVQPQDSEFIREYEAETRRLEEEKRKRLEKRD